MIDAGERLAIRSIVPAAAAADLDLPFSGPLTPHWSTCATCDATNIVRHVRGRQSRRPAGFRSD
jgi:hypothetical protein